MAGTAAYRRVDYLKEQNRYMGYEDGSAVRKLNDVELTPERAKRRSQALRARNRATEIGRGYVVFLALFCVIATVLCVGFLQQRSQLTTLNDEIGVLESRYTTIKGDNDAKYNQIISSFTLEDVKDAALTRLGMHYAAADQVRYYTLDSDSYVRQYKEVTAIE